MNIRNWVVRPLIKDRAAALAESRGLPPFLSVLLTIRGLDDPQALDRFLGEEAAFSDPLLMADMEKAAERINRAVEEMERIAVYGDYDADGVTATAMLYAYLETRGADVLYYIPQREGEGYGMNAGAVEKLAGMGVRLIVTVDNGIASVEETALAKRLGVDVVITDHHRPQGALPEAEAVVDAYREDDRSPFKGLCGAGVVFKLLMALEGEMSAAEDLLETYGDIAAIGTVGDVVPLVGENRTIVKYGLRALQNSERPGVRALLEASGAAGKPLTATGAAFSLVPRINATGRMGAPERAVRLLVTLDEEEAAALAEEICGENEERRRVENEIAEEAFARIERERLSRDRVIVVSGDGWHHGVIGIVASRVVERYGRPCIVLSRGETETKGSGRSVEGFSLFAAVLSARDLLLRFGGHPMAAGVTMKTENIEAFRNAVNRYAAEHHPRMPAVTTTVDCRLNPASLSAAMADEIARLEPFGTGNPQPVFGLFRMKLTGIAPVGGGGHLRLTFEKNGAVQTVMKFRTTAEEFPYRVGDTADLAVELENRTYRGQPSLSVILRDIRPSGFDSEKELVSLADFERFARGEPLEQSAREALLPDRAALAAVYRALRGEAGGPIFLPRFAARLPGVSLGKLLVALAVFRERGLLAYSLSGETAEVRLIEQTGKTDIGASPLLRRLSGNA